MNNEWVLRQRALQERQQAQQAQRMRDLQASVQHELTRYPDALTHEHVYIDRVGHCAAAVLLTTRARPRKPTEAVILSGPHLCVGELRTGLVDVPTVRIRHCVDLRTVDHSTPWLARLFAFTRLNKIALIRYLGLV